ncbi:ATP-binding protein [Rhodococcus gannanensis]|uniref:ATP-binding protein n=1 Tax=Rhodococcus gannanensis TaxID=1960308 RepID=A0ABW4P1W5_9NOCA
MTEQFAGRTETPPVTAGGRWSLTSVPAALSELAAARRGLAEFAASTTLPSDRVHDVALAAYEAMANAVEHAYPDRTAGTFDVRAVAADGLFTVTVTDRGAWKCGDPDPALRRGRGITLMRACSDHFELDPGPDGTTAVLEWTIPSTT